jgi:hypothetical protein
MKLLHGFNRRQKPLELICPGGRITISREPHGTILVRVQGENGVVEVDPKSKDYVTRIRLLHEAKEGS